MKSTAGIMNPIFKNIIIISAIIPSSILFYASVFWIFVFITDIFSDWPTSFVLTLCIFLGLLGYVGLWRNLISSKNRRGLNSLLPALGIAGYILFIFYTGSERMISFAEPFESLIMIWPIIVSIFVIVLNLKQDKK